MRTFVCAKRNHSQKPVAAKSSGKTFRSANGAGLRADTFFQLSSVNPPGNHELSLGFTRESDFFPFVPPKEPSPQPGGSEKSDPVRQDEHD